MELSACCIPVGHFQYHQKMVCAAENLIIIIIIFLLMLNQCFPLWYIKVFAHGLQFFSVLSISVFCCLKLDRLIVYGVLQSP